MKFGPEHAETRRRWKDFEDWKRANPVSEGPQAQAIPPRLGS